MIWIVLTFLALSVYLYCLLGGADFGVGVHELFVSKKKKRQHEEVVRVAMGPVWEANHMWIIITIVILFVGFPRVYAEVSTYLHIPITLMLVGIIMRGCAFSFRHYDAVEDGSRKYYSLIFSLSSILTPITFGMIVGALMLGKINPEGLDYYSVYVAPWLNLFTLATGFFILSIFTFIASIFMIGEETIGDLKKSYIRRAKIVHLIMIAMGGLVFLTAQMEGFPLAIQFLKNPIALTSVALATISHFLLWKWLASAKAWPLRFVAGFQLLMVVTAWMEFSFPNAITYADGSVLSFLAEAGPDKTLWMLGLTLIIGAIIFLPILGYLFFVFKKGTIKSI